MEVNIFDYFCESLASTTAITRVNPFNPTEHYNVPSF